MVMVMHDSVQNLCSSLLREKPLIVQAPHTGERQCWWWLVTSVTHCYWAQSLLALSPSLFASAFPMTKLLRRDGLGRPNQSSDGNVRRIFGVMANGLERCLILACSHRARASRRSPSCGASTFAAKAVSRWYCAPAECREYGLPYGLIAQLPAFSL